MPVLSRFFGIVVYMYWNDHEPPYFHAKYQGDEITVDIETGEVNGQMSQRAISMLQEWRRLHVSELRENWRRARGKKALNPIDPLE